MAVTDGIIMKGRHIIIPEVLQQWALEQLHINNMGIEKNTKLLVHESIYQAKISSNIDNYIKTVLYAFCFSKHSPRRR